MFWKLLAQIELRQACMAFGSVLDDTISENYIQNIDTMSPAAVLPCRPGPEPLYRTLYSKGLVCFVPSSGSRIRGARTISMMMCQPSTVDHIRQNFNLFCDCESFCMMFFVCDHNNVRCHTPSASCHAEGKRPLLLAFGWEGTSLWRHYSTVSKSKAIGRCYCPKRPLGQFFCHSSRE